jgi:hypothetical protein
MSDNSNSKNSTIDPHYIGWRGELLAKLALSRLGNVRIFEPGRPGPSSPVHDFDLVVMTPDALTFLVEVNAFSSIKRDIANPEACEWLDFDLSISILKRAWEAQSPVVFFLFDADTEHGRFMRIEDIPFTAGKHFQRVRFPIQNTITTASLNLLVREMRPNRMPANTLPTLPLDTSKIVIFDTNAYRNLTFGCTLEESREKVLKLRKQEQASGVMALANPFVIWELIGHLADKKDPSYDYCMNALVALAEHTWSPFDPNGGICRIADGETSVCRELFQKLPPNAEENAKNLSLMAAHVKAHAPDITLPAAITNFKAFTKALEKHEAGWLAEMQKVLNGLKPELAKAWVGGTTDTQTRRKLRALFQSQAYMDAWAVSLVAKFAKLVEVKLSAQETAQKADVMKKVFPVPFHLMAHALREWPGNKSFNLTSPKKKRANFVWDTALCFSIGNFTQVGDALVLFVTDDAAIRKAAEDAKCGHRVLTLNAHLNTVGFTSL